MSKHTVLLLLLVVLAVSTNALKYIADIKVDVQSGQIYVAEDNDVKPIIYELDDVSVEQNADHYLPSQSVDSGSLFIMQRGNKRALYAVLEWDTPTSTGDVTAQISYFKAPLVNKKTLPAQASQALVNGLSLAPTYDAQNHVGILSTSRNLTLVNLNNLNIQDSFQYWGNRVFGRNVVYNHNNNRVTVLYTAVPVRAPYGLSVDEYSTETGKFVPITTTYNCQCDTDPTASPFYEVEFPDASCDIDYTVSPARIWCPDFTHNQLFSFQAGDLSKYTITSTGAVTFDNVAWDFARRRAYAIDNNDDGLGYTVSSFNLDTGALLHTYTDATINVDVSTFEVDSVQPHLYIAVEINDDTEPTQIVSLNINNLTGHKLVTLTSDLS